MKIQPHDYVIVDLDGTVANAAHREHLAQTKQWDRFHELGSMDRPNEDVLWLLRQLKAETFLIFITGRNNRFRTMTLKWLVSHDVPCDVLLMRPDDDFSPDREMKPKLLEWYFRGEPEPFIDIKKRIRFVLEDRDSAVAGWRDYGLPCYQVRPGSY